MLTIRLSDDPNKQTHDLRARLDGVAWIDLLNATDVEVHQVEQLLGGPVPTIASLSEIEHSSRMRWEGEAIVLSLPMAGDNVGFWIGREFGYRLLRHYSRVLHLTENRVKVGHYLFAKWGGWVVFFGRFVAVLRAWAALFAGINRMPWNRFLFFNAAGATVWASVYGLTILSNS